MWLNPVSGKADRYDIEIKSAGLGGSQTTSSDKVGCQNGSEVNAHFYTKLSLRTRGRRVCSSPYLPYQAGPVGRYRPHTDLNRKGLIQRVANCLEGMNCQIGRKENGKE